MYEIITIDKYLNNRLLLHIKKKLLQGSVMAYPTDSGYALGCLINNKKGVDNISTLRNLDKKHHFTLMVNNLSKISEYAFVDNKSFRLLKLVLTG